MRSLLLLLAVGGCTLVDQNTFNPHAKDAPVAPVAPKVAVAAPLVGAPPLLVIGTSDPGAYGPQLSKAVAAARARKAGVVFDVVEMQAPDAADTALGSAGVGVARAIVAQGVPAGRVRLVARPEAGAVVGEVRVYVR